MVAVLAVGFLPTGKQDTPATEDRFVYLFIPEAERHGTSQLLVCFILASLRMGEVKASDGGVPTCARYGHLCGSKTTPGPFGQDTFPIASCVEVAPSPLCRCRRRRRRRRRLSAMHAHTMNAHARVSCSLETHSPRGA